jgi:hypothetical protein
MLVRGGQRGMGFSLSSITNVLVEAATLPLDVGARIVGGTLSDVGKVGGSAVGAAGSIVSPAVGLLNRTLVSAGQATGTALSAVRPQAVPTPVLSSPGSNLPIYLGGAALALVLVMTMSKKPAAAPAVAA